MIYPYKVEASNDGKILRGTLVDFNESVEGASLGELEDRMGKALPSMTEALRRRKAEIPLPSAPFEGCGLLYVPMLLQLRILLINLMREKRINGSELANLMGISRQRAQNYSTPQAG